ncbi:MAG: YigZ family protein [Pedobacter sp.]|nr:MAG: YigZ family protein [Pedobacter sp.]
MLFDDTYRTIKNPSEGIFRDKGSKFLAFAYPIKTIEDIKPLLTQLRTIHPKANHHCWGARITPDRAVFKLNDDGEPSGTAGRPILNAMLSADITNMLIVVVRYFGGTLLGVPGLINAYKTAAQDALSNAEIVTKTINDIYELSFDHTLMNHVMRIVKEEGLLIISQDYVDQNICQVAIRKSNVNKAVGLFNNLHGLKVKFLYSN